MTSPSLHIVEAATVERFATSRVGSKFDNEPRRRLVTWDELCRELTTPRRTACTVADCGTGMHAELDKDGKPLGCRHKNGAAWIPATFSKGRKKETVEQVSFLVVDSDHLPDDAALAAVLAKLERYRYVAHSTHSDRPGDRCARIVLPLSKSVPGPDWPRFWPTAMASLEMPADPSCCDAGRLYYEPARSSDADFWHAIHDGEALDVAAIVAMAPAVTPTIASQLKLDDSGTVEKGERHAMLKSLAGATRHRGAAEAEILAALTLANQRCKPPKPDSELADLAAWAAAQPITTRPKVSHRSPSIEPADDCGTTSEPHSDDDIPPPGDDDAPVSTKKRGKSAGAVTLAEKYVAKYATHADGVTLRRWRGDWYRWFGDRGCYVQWSDEQIESDLYRKLTLGKRGDVGDVRHALIAVEGVLIDHAELSSFLSDDAAPFAAYDVAACRNGILHLPDGVLTPATPRYFVTSSLGVAYESPVAAPVRWLAFLKQLWPHDDESIAALQEWFGYLLSPDTRQQKIFMLIGLKRSGKGTIIRVITALLGAANVCSPTLASLGTNFGLWPFIGKTAAIVGDARLGGRSDIAQVVERLLSISGEDGQTIDRKHRAPWTGKLSTRISIVSNEPPRFTDASDALASRMLLLELTESFFGREDVGLTDALLEELPGILRWSIDGWRRLRTRGRFVQPTSSAASIDELVDLASPVAAWARQRCRGDGRDPDYWLACTDAYTDFATWCERNGHHKPSQTVFGRDVKSATQCARRKISRRGVELWVYAGLELKS